MQRAMTGGIRVTKLVELFINQLSAEEKSTNTTEHYIEVLERFERWLVENHNLTLSESDIDKVNGRIMVEYYQLLHQRRLRLTSRNNYTVVLKKFFHFVQEIGEITVDPTTVLHCVKEKKRKTEADDEKEFSTDQLSALLELLSSPNPIKNKLRDAAVVALMLGSGLRISEVCSLNVSDAKAIKSGLVSCNRKGGNWINSEVADFVWPYIDRYLWQRGKCAPNEPLFLSQKGRRMTRTAMWKTLAYKQRSINLPTGTHRFRHTFNSDVDRNPIGGAAVARDLAGHKSIAITNEYLHSSHEERQSVVNSMGYAELFDE